MIDLTPLEVRKKKGDFRRGMRGYDPQAVDDFLDLVADRLEQLVRENVAMTERLSRVEDTVNDYRERERALTEALVTAQEMREEMRKQIEREVELKRREAEADAENIRNDALQIREREEESIRTLRARQSQFLQSYRTFLERELSEIAVMAESLEMTRGASQPAPPRRPRRRAEAEPETRRAEPEAAAARAPKSESKPETRVEPKADAKVEKEPEPVPMPLPVAVPMPDESIPGLEPMAASVRPAPPAAAAPPAPARPRPLEPEPLPLLDDVDEEGPFIPEPEPVVREAAPPDKSFDDMLNELPAFAGAAEVRQADETPAATSAAGADEEAELLAEVRAEFDSVAAPDALPAPEPLPEAEEVLELVDDVADDEDEDGWMSTLLEGKGDDRS